ncbi:MAG TPA: OmpA family protein [Burkholderiales bacterium]|nr:OmpA family protein [Burkholderiales bacterium]
MKPKTNRMLMLLVGVAIAGCSSQTERSSSGAEEAAIEHERVRGSTNAVTKEELERRAAAKAEAEKAATQSAPAKEPEPAAAPVVATAPAAETPPPTAAAAPAAQEEAAEFPITKYELPEDQAKNDADSDGDEELGPQEDESVSEAQDAAPEAESSVGETTEYADEDDSAELEELGPQDDESVSEAQEPAQEAESSVGETTEYADEPEQSAQLEELGPVADDSGTVSYPEDQHATENVVGEPTIYPDEKVAQAETAPPPKPAPSPTRQMSLDFETEPLFNFDKSQVRGDQRAKLDEFVSGLAGTQYGDISVTGHADRIGKDAYNRKLSERRANAVKAYLVSKGVPSDKVKTEGRGSSEPTTAGACDKTRGKALISCLQPDRRVEVSVSATKK